MDYLGKILILTLFLSSVFVFSENTTPECEICLRSCHLQCPCPKEIWDKLCSPSISDVPSDSSSWNTKTLVAFLVSTAAVLLLCGGMYLVYYLCQPTDADATTISQPEVDLEHYTANTQSQGLETSTIDGIPIFSYRNGDGIVQGPEECCVCLCQFEEGSLLRMLPNCKHAFHITCIDTWLHSHTTCPMCRTHAVSIANNGA